MFRQRQRTIRDRGRHRVVNCVISTLKVMPRKT
jgi:hypothetical protein